MKLRSSLAAAALTAALSAAAFSLTSLTPATSLASSVGQSAVDQSSGSETKSSSDQKRKIVRYVVDQAKVMDLAAEKRVTEAFAKFKQRRGIHVIMVTVADLGERTIDSFASGLAQHWGHAIEEAQKGILVVVAPNQEEMTFLVGPGLEEWMPQFVQDQLMAEYVFPHFRDKQYQEGLINAAAGIITVLGQNEPLGRRQAQLAPQKTPAQNGSVQASPAIETNPQANSFTPADKPEALVAGNDAKNAPADAASLGAVGATSKPQAQARAQAPTQSQSGAKLQRATFTSPVPPVVSAMNAERTNRASGASAGTSGSQSWLWAVVAMPFMMMLGLIAVFFFWFRSERQAIALRPVDESAKGQF